MRMEALLVRKGLWEVVSSIETKPMGSPNTKVVKAWIKKSSEVCAKIILRIDSSKLPHAHAPDAADVWMSLQRMHHVRSFATRMSLR